MRVRIVQIALLAAAAIVMATCSASEERRGLEPLELSSPLAVELREDLLATAPDWSRWIDDRPSDEREVLWDSLGQVAALQCDFIDLSSYASEIDLAALSFFGDLLEQGQARVFQDEIANYDSFLAASDRVYCGSRYASLQTESLLSS